MEIKQLLCAIMDYKAIKNGDGTCVVYVKYVKQIHEELRKYLIGYCLSNQIDEFNKQYDLLNKKDCFLQISCDQFEIKLKQVNLTTIKSHIIEFENDHKNITRKYYKTFEIDKIF